MDTRTFIARYFRSPLGIGSVVVALASAATALAMGAGIVATIAALVVAPAAILALNLATGLGQAAALQEGERLATGRAGKRMAEAEEARRRLAALRLPAGPVALARDLVVLEAGRLVETFATKGSWDPEAVAAVQDSLALVDAWQREADEAATERRFELPDANPFPAAAERTAAALREKAALISSHRAAASGEIPPVDRVAIEEELK